MYGTILHSAMSSMKSSTILALSIVSGRLADWLALCWLTFCPVIHSLSTFQRWKYKETTQIGMAYSSAEEQYLPELV